MEKEKLESLIIDYIDGRLHDIDRRRLEEELMANADARRLYDEFKEVIDLMEQAAPLEPSAQLKTRFDENLRDEIGRSGGRTVFFRPAFYRAAAAVALMVVSGSIGFWISRNNEQNDRLAQIEKEMELTRKQLADTKDQMMGMLGNELSASQRIQGVNVALGLQHADDEIVDALVKTMHTDASTNVRLAALGALAKFRHDPAVRKVLIGALSKQSDPMVQISLIQLLVQMKEKEVINELQEIVDDAGTMQAVKDEAYGGILKLS